MFKVNDYVVYGSTGVCQITDISKEKYTNGDETEYYVLHPVYDDKMTIKTPVNNKKVLMRKIITKDDIPSLIEIISENETIWINDDRQRSEKFKAALRTGKSEELAKLIKVLHTQEKEKSIMGKRLTKMDEGIMKSAEKQLYEEFAIALDISPDEVVPYILEHIS